MSQPHGVTTCGPGLEGFRSVPVLVDCFPPRSFLALTGFLSGVPPALVGGGVGAVPRSFVVSFVVTFTTELPRLAFDELPDAGGGAPCFVARLAASLVVERII